MSQSENSNFHLRLTKNTIWISLLSSINAAKIKIIILNQKNIKHTNKKLNITTTLQKTINIQHNLIQIKVSKSKLKFKNLLGRKYINKMKKFINQNKDSTC